MKRKIYYLKNQDEMKAIFDGANDMDTLARIDWKNEVRIFRRGYVTVRTQLSGGEYYYEVLSTRETEYYKYIEPWEVEFFLKHGFKKAADLLQVERDKQRLDSYTRKVSEASEQRNDSLIVHWKNRRRELSDRIARVEENLKLC